MQRYWHASINDDIRRAYIQLVRAEMHNHVDEGVAAIAYAGTRINVNINSGHRPSACTITTP